MCTKCIPQATAQTFPRCSVMSSQRAYGRDPEPLIQGLFPQLLTQGWGSEALPIPSPTCEPLDGLVVSLGKHIPIKLSVLRVFSGKTLLAFCRDWTSSRALGYPSWGTMTLPFLPGNKGNLGGSPEMGSSDRTTPSATSLTHILLRGNRSSKHPHLLRPWS